jgi:hypothetical protein
MKVLNLQCGESHVFEGWFGSEDDFQSQLARGLIACPLCADAHVVKLPSAPRLNLHAAASRPEPLAKDAVHVDRAHRLPSDEHSLIPAGSTEAASPGGDATSGDVLKSVPSALQGAVLRALREVIQRTENVGQRFPEEVRRMHHGESEARPVRGQANPQQVRELLDEGIEVLALPHLQGLNETLQ